MSALLALALAGCSGGAPPPDPRLTTSTVPRDPGQLDVLPNFRPVVTTDLLESLLGDQARYAREPKMSDRMLTWHFEGYAPRPDGGQEHLTLLVTAEIVTSFNGSSIGLARKFFETGMLDPTKFTEIGVADADDAAMVRNFKDYGDGFPYNHIRITTRTRNALVDVWYMNPTVSQQVLTSQAENLVADLVAQIS